MKKSRKNRYNQRDWAELAIIFIFLVTATIVAGFAGALILEVIFRLV